MKFDPETLQTLLDLPDIAVGRVVLEGKTLRLIVLHLPRLVRPVFSALLTTVSLETTVQEAR
jgi:hypothetical protein